MRGKLCIWRAKCGGERAAAGIGGDGAAIASHSARFVGAANGIFIGRAMMLLAACRNACRKVEITRAAGIKRKRHGESAAAAIDGDFASAAACSGHLSAVYVARANVGAIGTHPRLPPIIMKYVSPAAARETKLLVAWRGVRINIKQAVAISSYVCKNQATNSIAAAINHRGSTAHIEETRIRHDRHF